MANFEDNVDTVLGELKTILLAKNEKYGNSALEPVRIFSNASPKEQILVRLDDKLSRLRTQHINEDEDVATDLMGYLVLLKIADLQSPIGATETTTMMDDKVQHDQSLENDIRGLLRGNRDFSFRSIDNEGCIILNDNTTGLQFSMTDWNAFIEWYDKL